MPALRTRMPNQAGILSGFSVTSDHLLTSAGRASFPGRKMRSMIAPGAIGTGSYSCLPDRLCPFQTERSGFRCSLSVAHLLEFVVQGNKFACGAAGFLWLRHE